MAPALAPYAERVKREFTVVIERDEDGWFVGSVPDLPGCVSQGVTLDVLTANMRRRSNFTWRIGRRWCVASSSFVSTGWRSLRDAVWKRASPYR